MSLTRRSHLRAIAGLAGVAAAALTVAPRSLAQEAPAGPAAAPKSASQLSVRSARHDVLAGRRVLVTGRLSPGRADRRLALQVRKGDESWHSVAHARTRRGGAYRLRFAARTIGAYQSRVVYAGGSNTRPTRVHVGSLDVYRRVFVSHYGGGGALACGGRLTAGTIGVAHKTLPCGTRVHLRYRGRELTVRVIDRGPFIAGREYDLTDATHQRLGTGDLTTIEATR